MALLHNGSASATQQVYACPRTVGQSQTSVADEDTNDALDVKVLGVSTGSGLTQLNLAWIRYCRREVDAPLRIELLQYTEIPVAPSVRARVFNLLREAQYKPSVMVAANATLGKLFANSIKTFCQKLDIPYTAIDLVGTHAPIARRLHLTRTSDANNHALGWNTVITVETGITTVFDFSVLERAKQPRYVFPVAYIDRLLLRSPTKFRACLDINELVTLSFIPHSNDDTSRESISFYCGLGNLLVDYAMRYCTANNQIEDHDGKFAAHGTVYQPIVDRFINTYDYLRMAPPLHIATEMFGDHIAQRLIDECLALQLSEPDTLATITRIVAQTILISYRKLTHALFPAGPHIDELFICGPGARNINFIDYLEAELPESIITKPLDDTGIPSDANEAVCYAHLALEAVMRQVVHGPASTATAPPRADTDIVNGKIMRGVGWDELVQQIVQFSDGKPVSVAKSVSVVGCLQAAAQKLDLETIE